MTCRDQTFAAVAMESRPAKGSIHGLLQGCHGFTEADLCNFLSLCLCLPNPLQSSLGYFCPSGNWPNLCLCGTVLDNQSKYTCYIPLLSFQISRDWVIMPQMVSLAQRCMGKVNASSDQSMVERPSSSEKKDPPTHPTQRVSRDGNQDCRMNRKAS